MFGGYEKEMVVVLCFVSLVKRTKKRRKADQKEEESRPKGRGEQTKKEEIRPKRLTVAAVSYRKFSRREGTINSIQGFRGDEASCL